MPSFDKSIIISAAGHALFFCAVFFTFSLPLSNEKATRVDFLGSFLSRADFNQNLKNKANPPLNFITIYRKQDAQSSKPNFSFQKPLYPVVAVSSYSKNSDKFLAAEKKAGSQEKSVENNFQPAQWQREELKLKNE